MSAYNLQHPTLTNDRSYSFSDYFKLGQDVRDVAQFHGYRHRSDYLSLPIAPTDQARIDAVRSLLKATLPYIVLGNEQSRREFLISPVMQQVILESQAIIRTEYPLKISKTLYGTLDYLLQGQASIVVVEAKRGDLSLGFTQLAVELIAIDQWKQSEQTHILGAVSIGDVWQFGLLDRSAKLILQDLELYTIPNDLEAVVGILKAALLSTSNSALSN